MSSPPVPFIKCFHCKAPCDPDIIINDDDKVDIYAYEHQGFIYYTNYGSKRIYCVHCSFCIDINRGRFDSVFN